MQLLTGNQDSGAVVHCGRGVNLSSSSSVSSCASTTYFVTISRADRDSKVRQQRSDDSRTACCASFWFKCRSGASARDQTPVGCDPLSAEAEDMENADLSAVDAPAKAPTSLPYFLQLVASRSAVGN